MPLVNMKHMLKHAYENKYAIGAFDLVNLDFLTGIMSAAEKEKAPVILSLAESHFDTFDFELLMPAVVAAAKRASIPVAIHLDHGSCQESAVRSINLGCNGVMIDASEKTIEENTNITRALVEIAQGCGIPVEGEPGYVPGVEGEDAERHPGDIRYTTVDEAIRYVEKTGVDFLAVSIGTVHGRMQGKPDLNYQRLKEINEALGIPLVIHGGTGLSDDQFQQLIANGAAKINYYTALSDAAAKQIEHNSITNRYSSYTSMLKNIPVAISKEVERCIKLWGASGRSEEVLECCSPWREVEHVIIYNVKGLDKKETREMVSEGRKVLSTIPGVLEVFTGEAMKKGDEYQYTWLVRFCHPAVIDSYREHPAHVAFADNLFRPVAGNRISIDYLDWKK